MRDLQHEFQPLTVVQSVPVHWELSQDDYEKIHGGNDDSKSHWHWYMENNIIHIYKGFGGIEHFRFTVEKQVGGAYLVEKIDVHDDPHLYEQIKLQGWTKKRIEEGRVKYYDTVVEDVASMLLYFFDVKVDDKIRTY